MLSTNIPSETGSDNRPPFRSTRFGPLTMRELALRICEREGFSLDELRGDFRRKRFTVPRQEFMWLARQTRRWTYPQIAGFLRKDHTTVIHGVRAHERRLAG